MKKILFTISLSLLFCFSYGQTKDTSKTQTHVEVMPEYPGGTMEMMKFIQANIVYPKRARKKGITGKCFIKYTVMADGSIDNIVVLKGVPDCPECDEEGIRVIKLMPKWRPGSIDGKPVPVFFNLPINFTIKEK